MILAIINIILIIVVLFLIIVVSGGGGHYSIGGTDPAHSVLSDAGLVGGDLHATFRMDRVRRLDATGNR